MLWDEYKPLDKILYLLYNIVTFLYKRMTSSTARYVTTEDGGRQNMFAAEPQIEVVDTNYWKEAELLNGRLAMIGLIAGVGAVATTGQLIPGIL